MDAGALDRSLAEANPWWRDPVWAGRDVQLRRLAAASFAYDPRALAGRSFLQPSGCTLLRRRRSHRGDGEFDASASAMLHCPPAVGAVIRSSAHGIIPLVLGRATTGTPSCRAAVASGESLVARPAPRVVAAPSSRQSANESSEVRLR